MESKALFIGEGIDRLITIDLGARGIIYKLYQAARNLVEKPLVYEACEKIIRGVKRGDYVIITTGFRVPPKFVQETDGPSGAVSLARSFIKSMNARPLIVIEDESTSIIKNILRKIDVDTDRVGVLSYPSDYREAEKAAERIISQYSPSALIAVEKAGRNRKGVYHNMRGIDISLYHSKIETLFEEAKKSRILTIGIGDGGNEIGMGNIHDTVVKYVPYGNKCQCPCGSGIAAESKVDVLVTAAVSNWGAYGIEAMLAYLTSNKNAFHTPETEEIMLKAAIEAGAIDGVTGKQILSVDGIPINIHKMIVKMLRVLTES